MVCKLLKWSEAVRSTWKEIQAGVPHGSVLGPLLFFIYINDIHVDINSDCSLFVDDALLLKEVSSPTLSARSLNNDLNAIYAWSNK